MRFVSVRELRSKAAQVWQVLADEGEVVITNNGKPIAVLAPTSEAELEGTLKNLRRARAFTAVERMQGKAPAGEIDVSDINAEIAAVRAERHILNLR